MEDDVRALFQRYVDTFNRGLQGEDVSVETSEYFASEFIASVPAGVHTGKNGASFRQSMAVGYQRYREQGFDSMVLGGVRAILIDDCHSLAFVEWTASYLKNGSVVSIPFTNCYFLRRDDRLSIIGWVAGDEEAELKKYGIS